MLNLLWSYHFKCLITQYLNEYSFFIYSYLASIKKSSNNIIFHTVIILKNQISKQHDVKKIVVVEYNIMSRKM